MWDSKHWLGSSDHFLFLDTVAICWTSLERRPHHAYKRQESERRQIHCHIQFMWFRIIFIYFHISYHIILISYPLILLLILDAITSLVCKSSGIHSEGSQSHGRACQIHFCPSKAMVETMDAADMPGSHSKLRKLHRNLGWWFQRVFDDLLTYWNFTLQNWLVDVLPALLKKMIQKTEIYEYEPFKLWLDSLRLSRSDFWGVAQ